MAEVVFQNLEELLPELEDLERQGIFTREELRVIIRRRTDFEYKLQKRVIAKPDVLAYIEYEMKLDQLRKKRCKRLKLKSFATSALSITKKIHSLFRKALMKFSNDLKLWKQYLEFCKSVGSTVAINRAFGKLLQVHPHNIDCWLMAAKYEFELDNNVSNARSLLFKGLRHNKESKLLWHEYFRLELLHVNKIKNRQKLLGVGNMELKDDNNSDPEKMEDFLKNKTAHIAYEKAIQTIDGDVDFRIGFLDICQLYDEVDELEDQIINNIREDFPNNESLSCYLATRTLNKLRNDKSRIIIDDEWIIAETECKESFQHLIKTTDDNKELLWQKYLNEFVSILKQSTTLLQAQRRIDAVFKIMQDAESSSMTVTESMYLLISEICENVGHVDLQLSYLTKALDQHKHSVVLWKNYLSAKANSCEEWIDLKKEFQRCRSVCKEDVSYWHMYLDASLLDSEQSYRETFQLVLETPSNIKNNFLPAYLKYLNAAKEMKAVRKLYSSLFQEKVNVEFWSCCIEVEKSQESPNLQRIRKLYEKLIEDYGSDRTDIWLSYVEFEKQQDKDVERMGVIHNKAIKRLGANIIDEFTTKFSQL